jgi:hypothetical protein
MNELDVQWLSLIDVKGRVVYSEEGSGANNRTFQIDVSTQPEGLYFVEVTALDGQQLRKKLIVKH